MPPGKKSKKMNYSKAKKVVAKANRSKAKKNMDTFALKLRVQTSATPKQGTVVSNYMYLFWSLITATSVVGVTQLPEFILYRNLYDRVRINSMKLTFTPKANVLDQANAQNDGALTVNGDGMAHTVIDRDGAAPSNIARLSRVASYQKYSVLKKFSRAYSIKYPTGVWLDCQNIYRDPDLINQIGGDGGLTVYAENLLEDSLELFNEPVYDIQIEYNVVFQGRAEGSIQYDPDTDSVKILPSNPAAYAPYSDQIPVYNTIADKRFDASGNIVPVTDTDNP